MNNQIESSEVKTKNITFGLIIGWILGAILILIGIVDIFSDPFSGIFFLLAGLVVIPPVTRILKEKYNYTLKRSFKIVGIIIFLVLASATGKHKEVENIPVVVENTTPIVTEQTPSVPATPQTLEEKVTGAITAVLGDQTNMSKPRVIEISKDKYIAKMLSEYGYVSIDEKVSLLVQINASENLTTKLQKSTMNKEATQVFQNVFSVDPTIADIIVWSYIPTSDKYGNNKDDVGIVYSMSDKLYKKINWANFQYTDLPSLLLSEGKVDDRNSYFEKIKF